MQTMSKWTSLFNLSCRLPPATVGWQASQNCLTARCHAAAWPESQGQLAQHRQHDLIESNSFRATLL